MIRIDQTTAIFPENKTESSASIKDEQSTTDSFTNDLQKALDGVRDNLATADQDAANAVVGNGSPHEAMLSLAQAELSFRMATQVRNKMMEAYREIMRMQL